MHRATFGQVASILGMVSAVLLLVAPTREVIGIDAGDAVSQGCEEVPSRWAFEVFLPHVENEGPGIPTEGPTPPRPTCTPGPTEAVSPTPLASGTTAPVTGTGDPRTPSTATGTTDPGRTATATTATTPTTPMQTADPRTPATETPTPDPRTPDTSTPDPRTPGTPTQASRTPISTPPTPTPTPTSSATATVRAPLASGIQGVQVFEGDVETVWSGQVRESGAHFARTRILWSSVEPVDAAPATRIWTQSDSVLSGLGREGFETIAALYSNPPWAATTPCGPVDRVPVERWTDFVGAAVERYDGDGIGDAPGSPRIGYWEISNEPDFMLSQGGVFGDPAYGYGGCFGDDPLAYAQLLRRTFFAVKDADPAAIVLFGSLAYDRFYDNPDYPSSNRGPFRYDFARVAIDHLWLLHRDDPAFPFFDVMAFHNYNDFRNFWDQFGDAPEILGKAHHLRENQMSAPESWDVRGIPMLVTEVGIPGAPADRYTARSDELQAAYVGQVLVRSMAAGLLTSIWYTAEDNEADTSACADPYAWKTHGLMRSLWVADRARQCASNPLPNYAPSSAHERKPAFTAFQTFARLIGGANFEERLSVSQTGDASIDATRVTLQGGGSALVAFTDNGERLGHRGFPDIIRSLTVSATLMPGWTGRVRITDFLGSARVEEGQSITIPLDHHPVYVEVVP